MKAAIIALRSEDIGPLLQSIHRHAPGLVPIHFPAITPDRVPALEHNYRVSWTYPDHGSATLYGLKCHAYSGDKMKRRAIFWSHMLCWEFCAVRDEPIIVLESDAVFTDPLRLQDLEGDYPYGMISLNDPRGATRRANAYHRAIQQIRETGGRETTVEVPSIDDLSVPQGLPGHSAYYLRPTFARELLANVSAIGAWPNDALVNKQFFPGLLGCLTNYVTRVSGRKSNVA